MSNTTLLLIIIFILPVAVICRFFHFSLWNKKQQEIETNGIIHYTFKENNIPITESGYIKAVPVAITFKMRSYFFINNNINCFSVTSNHLKNHNTKIVIKNLTNEQLNKMRYRPFDKAVLYNKDFIFCEENIIDIIQINLPADDISKSE